MGTFIELLNLQKALRYRGYDKLELTYLNKLRAEVEREVERAKAQEARGEGKG